MLVQLSFCLDQHQDQDQAKHPSLKDKDRSSICTNRRVREGGREAKVLRTRQETKKKDSVSEERIKRNLNITSWGSVLLVE